MHPIDWQGLAARREANANRDLVRASLLTPVGGSFFYCNGAGLWRCHRHENGWSIKPQPWPVEPAPPVFAEYNIADELL